MLLSQHKELRVVLCPDKSIVVVLRNGLRRKVISQAIVPATPASTSDWRPAMETLEQWLKDSDLEKANVKILLSSSFIRFAMMPFSEDVSNYAERLAVVGLLFESIYGETAKQWKLTLDDEEFGEPCLAVAMDTALWDALNQMVASSPLRIVSIQPYVASVLNAFINQIHDGESLLVVVENGQAILIDIRNKKIVGVRKTMLSVDSDESEIVSLLQREMLISGLNEEIAKVYLHVASNPSLTIPTDTGMNIIALRHESKTASALRVEDTGYEMACMGI